MEQRLVDQLRQAVEALHETHTMQSMEYSVGGDPLLAYGHSMVALGLTRALQVIAEVCDLPTEVQA